MFACLKTDLVLVFTFAVFGGQSFAQPCRSYNRQSGLCIPILNCPPLLRILRRNPTQLELLTLQKLTCGFDSGDPKVCCPRAVISPPVNAAVSSSPSTTARTTPSPPPISTLAPYANVPKYTAEELLRPSLQSHPKFSLLPSLQECSISIGINSRNRIVGGEPATAGSYPWMARIGYLGPTQEISYFCAGSIINKRYILTASHCTFSVEGYSPKAVRLGENDARTNPDCNYELDLCGSYQDYGIEKITHHPEYNTVTKQNDISLIRVDRDIEYTYFIQPICLPLFKEYDIENLTLPAGVSWNEAVVAGWGKTGSQGQEGSDKLLEVALPFVPNEKCKDIYSKRITITPKQVCAGGLEGKDSCAGDSGGPLTARHTVSRKTRDMKLFQVGIVSYGPVNCGVGGLPGVYARVSQYLNWILDNIEA